jgi:serine/threonine protein kinase
VGSREHFVQWLWNLVDFNCNGIITLEELRVFLQALKEDGIDLEELAFYKESGVPLDECIINEFDTTHAGGLEQDEFMVLADLVTREYEYWENRHLDCIGDYELGRTVGRGSSGVVRLGVHVETHEKFAVKIIRKGKCADMSSVDREIQALKVGKHEHVVDLEQVLESEENMFLVLGLCGGGSLANVVRLYPDQRMPERTARFYLRQILEALAFCHEKGICHRDVRLDNILLDNAGMVKITDFGHSKMFSAGWDLHSSTLVGSIYNLSPEQVAGSLYSGEKIDIWSTGVAVYSLLVGCPPFCDADSAKLLENISTGTFATPDFLSEEAADLIRCMIRILPDERVPLAQLLQHPWFYVDVEHCPQMDVYTIAVDEFFKRRPDLAEMIMAGTIHEHNLHFHLADTLNPTSSPEDLRGQDWSLKCLCPQMDIKFAVSLFSSPPRGWKDGGAGGSATDRLQCAASYSVLQDAFKASPAVDRQAMYSMFDDDGHDDGKDGVRGRVGASASDAGAIASASTSRAGHVSRSKSLDRVDLEDGEPCAARDALGGSVLVDAFPHRKVLPRKEVPEATLLFDSEVRIAAAAAAAVSVPSEAAARLSHLQRSITMEGVASVENRRRALAASESVTKSLAQHPSKAHAVSMAGVEVRRGTTREPTDFVPFIEVRLQCGESGLFLRICHKLKMICANKLVAAAESQRLRSVGRKTASASISAFRRAAPDEGGDLAMPA